uniref:Rac/Cdc42 guanine nucleotide exchange factor (GEF) 6 n=1 Tax=Kryptolebias marmoratus TaxID=37003 RepID=A0A3Q2ZVC5_KRYMA
MNPEEQTVTWLISLGVLSSPKKNIADPEEFLKTSLKDGVVLCKLAERFIPGFAPKYCQDPRTEADCISNIKEFLRGCSTLKVEGFEPEWLYTGENFGKVLNTLLGVNFATQGKHFSLFCVLRPFANPSSFKYAEMSENCGGGQLMVKARFNFKQNNEDELSFNKGDLILVTRQEEGGWWEGTLNGKTGWFPSNYVREIKSCGELDPSFLCIVLSLQVVKDILEHERDFVKELQTVLSCYLRPLQASDNEYVLYHNVCYCCTRSNGKFVNLRCICSQQRVAACYLNLMTQLKSLYLTYCSGHPSAVSVLTDHSAELDKFMESQGVSTSGILTLTTSLSKPFMRLDKYPTLLQELERHVEEAHPDYADIIKATAAFKNLVTQCQDLRKRKILELEILSEAVRGWEGDSMKSLGHVVYMSQAHVRSGCSEEKEERYLMLFSNVLVMLSASPRMSGFIYQGRVSLTGTTLTRQADESDSAHYAFDITGSMIDRFTVFCSSPQELQEWLEHLQPFTKGGSPTGTISKSTVGVPSHPPHLGSIGAASRSSLEPPKISKPWSLSCLRPAPPLKPSAALGYKERMSYIMKDSSKSPRPMKKFLPGNRKKERKPSDDEIQIRKSTVALEEDAQILRVIEAYCTGASAHQTVRKESVPQVLLPEEEKIIVEEIKSNGQTVIEEKSLVDAVYALKDEVHELKKENKWMKQFLEEEQKSRKELERLVRKLTKQKNDCAWEDSGH